ncbi:DNA-processing protein DprA [Colwelliaceae bacterium 6471]
MPKTVIQLWLALKLIPRLAIHKKLTIVREYGLNQVFYNPPQTLKSALTEKQLSAIEHPDWQRIDRIISASEHCQSEILCFDDSRYPELLKEIYDPPLVLFTQGNLALLACLQLAVVGSRHASASGREITQEIAKQAVQNGIVVTSGLALGVDAAAHKGALLGKGGTIAVVATGLDMVYPSRHRKLAADILSNNGAIISEFLPGTPPKAGHFPRRNRLISGLSSGVLVVEAALKSGSLITARSALEQNRDVFAVPGSVLNPYSQGCHWLIKQGAKLVEDFADIKGELAYITKQGLYFNQQEKSNKDAKQRKFEKSIDEDLFLDPLLASVGYEITPVDKVVSRSKLPTDVVLTRLTMLELRGLVSAVPGGYLRLNRG